MINKKTGKRYSYTPRKTDKAEWEIRETASRLIREHGMLVGVPVKVVATFYRLRPKSAPKRVTKPMTNPDLPNYFMLLADALSGLVIYDDGLVTSAVIKKRFGAPERIEIRVEEDLEE